MTNSKRIRKITTISILAAILSILAFLPVRVSALEITLTVIPIAVGIILYGMEAGIILGSLFGVISFLQCLGYSPFGSMILSINPWLTFLVCVPTRILVGVVPSIVHKLLLNKNKMLAQIMVCVLVPVLNTFFFMTMLCVGFYNSDVIQGFVDALNAANPFMFVILFVGVNGLVEMLCGIFVSYPVSKALEIVSNK